MFTNELMISKQRQRLASDKWRQQPAPSTATSKVSMGSFAVLVRPSSPEPAHRTTWEACGEELGWNECATRLKEFWTMLSVVAALMLSIVVSLLPPNEPDFATGDEVTPWVYAGGYVSALLFFMTAVLASTAQYVNLSQLTRDDDVRTFVRTYRRALGVPKLMFVLGMVAMGVGFVAHCYAAFGRKFVLCMAPLLALPVAVQLGLAGWQASAVRRLTESSTESPSMSAAFRSAMLPGHLPGERGARSQL